MGNCDVFGGSGDLSSAAHVPEESRMTVYLLLTIDWRDRVSDISFRVFDGHQQVLESLILVRKLERVEQWMVVFE